MASKKQLIIAIDQNGYVKAEVTGIKGAACKDYIALVEELVNGKTTNETLTEAYYQQEINQQNDQKIYNQ